MSTRFSSPETALPASPTVVAATTDRINSVESNVYSSLNLLDDDVNRLETVIGISADATNTGLAQGRIVQVNDTLKQAIERIDAAASLATGVVETDKNNLTGTVSTTKQVEITNIDTGTDTFTTAVTHNLTLGQPVRISTTATMPAPVLANETKYVSIPASNQFRLHNSSADAIAGTSILNITTSGTGTISLNGSVVHGSGTSFTQNFEAENYIYIADLNKKAYEIQTVESDTVLTLTESVNQSDGSSTYKKLDRLNIPIIQTVQATSANELITFGQFKNTNLARDRVTENVRWTSVSSVTIPDGTRCLGDNFEEFIIVDSGDLVVSFANPNGPLGLDTGTESSDTFYYVWLCQGSLGVTAIFSESNTAPTLPDGYNIAKRRLPGVWRNNASSDIIKSVVRYKRGGFQHYTGLDFLGGVNKVLVDGSANVGSPGTVDCSSLVPPGVTMALIKFKGAASGAGSGDCYIRTTGDTVWEPVANGDSNSVDYNTQPVFLDSSQTFQYYTSSGSVLLSAWVMGIDLEDI